MSLPLYLHHFSPFHCKGSIAQEKEVNAAIARQTCATTCRCFPFQSFSLVRAAEGYEQAITLVLVLALPRFGIGLVFGNSCSRHSVENSVSQRNALHLQAPKPWVH